MALDDVTLSHTHCIDKSHGLEMVCVRFVSLEMNNPKLMHVDDDAYDYYYCK